MIIKDSIFLITGGSSGIGKTTAKLLIGLGGKVVITGLDKTKLVHVAESIGAFPIQADVASDSDIEKTFDLIIEKYGKLDVLINNAGIGVHKPIENLNRKDFDHTFQVNVYGMAMMSQKAAEIFKKQSGGSIINIGSTSGLNGYKTGSVYSASKFAVRGLTQCLQAELRPHNIRVMLINPSEVPTAFGSSERIERPDVANKISSAEIAHTIVSTLSMDNRGMVPETTIWATNPW
ncbi:MAG: 3-oxoacyl-[acyl-carrier protein] reductase [Salibacteraceae bacterium]|jgi:3-oxoacyl-[acyl-carrier protein] reductase